MAFTREIDETDPAGNTAASLGDNELRNLKADINDRIELEHYPIETTAAAGAGASSDETLFNAQGRHKPPFASVLVDTAANILASDPFTGSTGYGTDTGLLYIANGTDWTTYTIDGSGGGGSAANKYAFLMRHDGNNRTYSTLAQNIRDWETPDYDFGGNCISGSHADNSGKFVAPIDGIYAFTMGVEVVSLDAGSFLEINGNINGTNSFRFKEYNDGTSSRAVAVQMSFEVSLNSGQHCQPWIDHNDSGTVIIEGSGASATTFFCGHLVGSE